MLYWSALVMGLVGNFHCLGMCGPIALAIPINRSSEFSKIFSILLYNSGRVFMYTFFGFLFGLFGKGVALAGMQQQISIVLGVLIVLSVIFPFVINKLNFINQPLFSRVVKIKNAFQKHLKNTSYTSIFTLGILNGLLPCGLVFMAVAGAISAGSWQGGALYMMLFGIGTLPVMVALPYFGQLINQKTRKKFNKLVPIVVLMFGVLLIVRGSNLGVKYLSPKVETSAAGSTVICE